jgi:hypothetical protein
MDPQTGIAGAMFVNVSPFGDKAAYELFRELEQAVYAELVPRKE